MKPLLSANQPLKLKIWLLENDFLTHITKSGNKTNNSQSKQTNLYITVPINHCVHTDEKNYYARQNQYF